MGKEKMSIIKKFCDKQGFSDFEFTEYSVHELISFGPELHMSFRDVLLDMLSHIRKGVAVCYMQGIDMDLEDAMISKELSYKGYLKSKKLI